MIALAVKVGMVVFLGLLLLGIYAEMRDNWRGR